MTKPEEFAAQSDIAALTVAEQRYRALVRATSPLVWVTAADGQIADMPEWRAYTGESVEQIKGWGWLNSLHPDDRERAAVAWQRAVDARSFYETDYRIRRNDGVYVWHRARGVPVLEADGSIREWVGICLDITQRRQAEEKRIEAETALRRLNETLEQRVQAETRERLQIWNVSQDLLVIVGLDGKYLSVNPAWTATLGWSEADLLGKSSQWLLHPDDRDSTRAELDHLAQGHKMWRFENRLRAQDGSYRWISWKAAPDSGRIYSMGRDITEHKRAEEALRELESDLAHMNRLHIMGEQAASRMVKDATWADDIIKRTSALYQKDSTREHVDINAVIREMVLLFQQEAGASSTSIRTNLAERIPDVMADRVQLQQVFMNLMLNGIEAMKDSGGELTITSQPGEGAELLISVNDTGPGLPTENPEQIFESFVTTKPHGTGMGLAITRSIVESHGGRLWATANAGPGATFRFTLLTDAGAQRPLQQH